MCRGYPVEDYHDTRWSTQAKVEGMMLKAAWHWVVIAVLLTVPWGNQATPHCM